MTRETKILVNDFVEDYSPIWGDFRLENGIAQGRFKAFPVEQMDYEIIVNPQYGIFQLDKYSGEWKYWARGSQEMRDEVILSINDQQGLGIRCNMVFINTK